MRRSTPLRNVSIAAIITLLLGLCAFTLPAVSAQGALVVVTPNPDTVTGAPGTIVTRTYTITNNDTIQRTFSLSSSVTTAPANAVTVSFPSNPITVNGNGSSNTFSINFAYASTAPSGSNLGYATITFNSSPSGSVVVSGSLLVTLLTSGNAPTATPTATTSPTPTATVGPTATPQPICLNGRERDDPGNSQADANLLRVNVPEVHGICGNDNFPSPDVDWFYFAAGAGKVYTIDVPQMSDGLDLVLELYDANGKPLAQNDDFYQRNPNNTSDLKPRIQSWRAPYDGLFYILVHDKLNSGGGDRTYTIVVNGESFGPTPTLIPELCNDIYEQDGLPETATLMYPNEVQPAHVLCPTGDADWIKFFGARGKSYFIYTDTRPYRNNPNFNRDTESGADTIMFLFDRDGITKLAESDDIPNSLDSEIRFVPPVDGFYYVQVKNRGDLGNQFTRYDLTLKLCVAGDTACGRAEPVVVATSTPRPGNQPTATTDPGFSLTRTATPTSSPIPTSIATTTSSAQAAFLAFSRVWQRADQPIVAARAARSWLWGPAPRSRISESYSGAAGGQRAVEYYDKARMEITNPNASQSSQWYVTNGLLVTEMVRGQMQIGDKEFASRAPAAIPVVGDLDDTNGPTYASLAAVTARKSGDRSGQYVAETLDRAGNIGDYSGPRLEEARLAYFVSQTGYNIPQVFWQYLNRRATIYEGGYRDGLLMNWLFTLGYPISDPYWATVKVGGVTRQVLLQPFERRVLTFDPQNPVGWQVEMGNVGRHYYQWRYGRELPGN